MILFIKRNLLKISLIRKLSKKLKIYMNRNNDLYHIECGDQKKYSLAYNDAIVSYSRAISLNPKNWKAYYKKAGIELTLKNYDKAIANYSKVISLDAYLCFIYFERGYAKELSGDFENAIIDYNKNLKNNPDCPLTLKHLALSKEKLGDKEGALVDLTKSLKTCEKYYGVYRERGRIKLSLLKYEEALLDFHIELDNDPFDDIALDLRSKCYAKLGDFENSYNDMKRANSLNKKARIRSFLKS